MKWLTKVFAAWFSLSRSERNGTFILAFFILLVVLGWVALPNIRKPWMPDRNALDREMRKFITATDSIRTTTHHENVEILPFDPNTASFELLVSAGLSRRTATNLLRFREKGGRIKAAEDMKKLYGITEEEWNSIHDKLEIPSLPDAGKSGRDSFLVKGYQPTTKPKTGLEIQLIELNSADSLVLESLPGIGPVLASRIVKYRLKLGGFIHLTQLLEVYGMNPDWYKKLEPRLRVDSTLIHPLDLNQIRSEAGLKHPYLTPWQVQALWKYLSMGRKVQSSRELIENRVLKKEDYDRIRPYLIPR